MTAPDTGNYWKTPFIWEPGCPTPVTQEALRFEEPTDTWLFDAIAQVMSDSLDESDSFTVVRVGAAQAVAELMGMLPQYFERPAGWWRACIDAQDRKVGFVLPVLFKDPTRWKDGKPQGTIFYMGVLPEFRGRGYSLALVNEATRLFNQASCWRIFCDTGTSNVPMVNAFRMAGYTERSPWQRPIG